MIEADIKRKLPEIANSEDVLTSTVFGLLKYRLMHNILAKFIGKAVLYQKDNVFFKDALNLTQGFQKGFEISFWKNCGDYGKPDLLIEGAGFAVVVEVKLNSTISGTDQLRRYHA